MKLNFSQRKSLGDYCGNLSIAWFAAGIIGPYVTRQDLRETWGVVIFSLLASGFFLMAMLVLMKGGRREV